MSGGSFLPGRPLANLPAHGSAGARRLRRSELELVVEVLRCLDAGVTQLSAILRRANLSYTRFAEITATLESRGLLTRVESSGRTTYAIEPRGREFLSEYRSFRRLMETVYGFEL